MKCNDRETITSWKWRSEFIAYSVVGWLAKRLPCRYVFRIGEAIGLLAWFTMSKRRRIVVRNLRIAMAGELEAKQILRLARQTFTRSGANLISASHTARLTAAQVRNVIEMENLNLLEEAQRCGQGVVLLLAHMGNWELLTKLIHLFPPNSKCGAFYRPLSNPLIEASVLARRQADGTRLFSKRDPLHQVTGFLRDGGIVGILADQRVGLQGEVLPFFGRLTRASPLPSLLARRAKARVLALSLVTDRPGHWTARLLPVPSPPNTIHCMAALENSMKSSPIDVFWLQERWMIKVRPKRPFSKWLPLDAPIGQKPHRALIWLPGVSPSWHLPDTWLHPDLIYEAILDAGVPIPHWLPKQSRIHRITVKSTVAMVLAIDADHDLPLDFVITGPGTSLKTPGLAAHHIPAVQLA